MEVYCKTINIDIKSRSKKRSAAATVDSKPINDYMCCCRPELEHNELSKLILVYKDDDDSRGDRVVFPQEYVDQLQDGNRVDIGDSKFSYRLKSTEVSLQGQNILIHELLFKMNNQCKVVYMYGPKNSGKTLCCEFFMYYCEARDKNIKPFLKDVTNQCPHNDTAWPLFYNIRRDSNNIDYKYIYILDNADKMLTERWSSLQSQMKEFPSNFFFIVTYSNKELQGKLAAKIHMNKEALVPVGDLTNKDAAKYIVKNAKNCLAFAARNPDDFQSSIFPEKYYKMSLIRSLLSRITLGESKARSFKAIAEIFEELREKENEVSGESRPRQLKEEFKELMK